MKLRLLLLAGLLALPFAAQAQTTNGRVTTSAPTYTTGTTAPLSLDTSGNVRTNCVSGCAGGNFNNNADAVATSSTNGATAAYLYGYNGASFDRLRVDANKYLNVDIQTITATLSLGAGTAVIGHVINDASSAVIGHVIADSGSTTAVTGNVTVVQGTGTNLHAVLDTTSTTAVTQATGTNLHAVLDTTSTTAVTQATGTNLHAVIDTGSTTAVTQATGTNLHAVIDTGSTTAVTQATAANLNATVVLAAGSALAGKVGIDQTTPGTTNGVSTVAATSGGTSISTLTLANTTNATNVKASAGQLYGISGFNISSATPVWISLYNNSGTPTCGTAIIEQFMIPGSTTGSGYVYDFATPHAYGTGIAFCATTGIAGTGAPAATTYVVNISYK